MPANKQIKSLLLYNEEEEILENRKQTEFLIKKIDTNEEEN